MRRIGLRQMQAGQKGSIISVDADGVYLGLLL